MEEYFVKEKNVWERTLDLLVFFSVLVVVIFLILELLGTPITSIDMVALNDIYFWVSIVVLIIFAIDLVRLWRESDGMKDFVDHNWLDILATIPFGLIGLALGTYIDRGALQGPFQGVLKLFRISRLSGLARTQKVTRVSKIGKQFKAASHFKKESEEYQKKHRL